MIMSVAIAFAADPDVTIAMADFDLPSTASQSEVEYSNGNITIGIYNGKKQTSNGSIAVLLTKGSGYVKLPAFASAVEKIVFYSNPGASAKAVVQVMDGDTMVGSVAANTANNTTPYEVAIPEDMRNASAEYKLIPTTTANAQISKIEVYLSAGGPVDPVLEVFAFEGFHDYLLNPGELAEWSLGSIEKPAIVFASSNEAVATANENGILAGEAGKAEITATWEADDRFAAGSATFAVEVKAADIPDPDVLGTTVLDKDAFGMSGQSYVAYSYTDEFEVTYQSVASVQSDVIGFNTKNANGKASGIVVTSNKNDVVIASVSVKFVSPNKGVKIYSQNAGYDALTPGTAPSFGDAEPVVTDLMDETPVAINNTAFAIVPMANGVIAIESVTVTYVASGDTPDPKPEKTVVTLGWNAEAAEATVGEAFEAPVLSVDPEAAAEAVCFKSENEEVATVDAQGNVTVVAAGETSIVAYIPADNEEYTAQEAAYTLTVKDAETPDNPEKSLVLLYTGKTYSGGIAHIIETTGEGEGVFTYTVEGVLDFSYEGANGSEFRVYAGKDIVFTPAEGVTLTKIVFKDTNSKTTTISADKGECVTESRLTTWTGAATDAVTISTTAQIRINYFEIYYTVAAGEKAEVSNLSVAATVATEEVAETVKGVELTAAAAFRLTGSAETTAPAVAFEYEGKAWTVAAEDGKVEFTADYLPAPAAESVLSYYGCSLDGEALTEVAQAPVNCSVKLAEKFTLTLDGHKFKATVNEENTAVQLDLKLAHSLVHHHAANAELPYLVDYKLTSANHGELEVTYDLATDTATVKNFIVLDIDPTATIDDVALMLQEFEFAEEHSLEAEPELLFPVLVAAEPVVVAGAPAQAPRRAAGFEAARPELTLVSGTPAKAEADQPLIALPHTKMVMNDDVATGIESVAADLCGDAPVECFNLQGIRILNPAKGQVVIRRQANGQVAKLRF